VDNTDFYFVAIIIFFGSLSQSLTGFGAGLVTMAFLPRFLGIRLASPVVALVNLALEAILMIRFRQAFQFHTVWPMIVASAIMIPLGVWGLSRLNEVFVTRILGLVMIGYSLWEFFGLRLPELSSRYWGVLAGGLGGLLGGAYNTGGPPVIIYGNCQRWPPAEFKANLTGYFIINSVLICTNHALNGHFSKLVMSYFLIAIPALLSGVLVGFRLEYKINPQLFRKVILIILFIMGFRMLFIRI